MRYKIKLIFKIGKLIFLCFLLNKVVAAQGVMLKNECWKIKIGQSGVLQSMKVKYQDGWDDIPVRQDSIYAGN